MTECRNSAQLTINSLHAVTPACQQHAQKSFEPYRFVHKIPEVNLESHPFFVSHQSSDWTVRRVRLISRKIGS